MASSSSSPSSSPFDALSDELVGAILVWCDLRSAARFATATSGDLRRRFLLRSGDYWKQHAWGTIFDRHGFCLDEEETEGDLGGLCVERRRLLEHLVGRTGQPHTTKKGHPFRIPNRCFRFLPVLPVSAEDEDDDFNFDPPPAFYECDAFVLTGCGVRPELVLLDPFDGSLRVLENLLAHATTVSEEAMALEALRYSSAGTHGWWSESKRPAPAAKGPARSRAERPPTPHCLLRGDDCFHLDLSEYFPGHDRHPVAPTEEEFDLHHLGVDAKPILAANGRGGLDPKGTLVCFGRTLVGLDREGLACTEFIAWERSPQGGGYGAPSVCRVPSAVHAADLDATRRRVFCSFPGEAIVRGYPLPPPADPNQTPTGRFPGPCTEFRCGSPVGALLADATGEQVLAATSDGTLEVWEVPESAAAKRLDRIDPRQKLGSAIRGFTERHSSAGEGRFLALKGQPELPHFRAPARALLAARHSPMERTGFLTLHQSHGEAGSLLVWRWEGGWSIDALIRLPLSGSRTPRVCYDGNKIVVLGEDPVGVIVLVYQVAGPECREGFDDETTPGEASGGVTNLSSPARVRFANRIRHAALGGLGAFDLPQISCNERFLVAHTKTGNLLGASPHPEGLLVIDLLDPSSPSCC